MNESRSAHMRRILAPVAAVVAVGIALLLASKWNDARALDRVSAFSRANDVVRVGMTLAHVKTLRGEPFDTRAAGRISDECRFSGGTSELLYTLEHPSLLDDALEAIGASTIQSTLHVFYVCIQDGRVVNTTTGLISF